MNPIDAARATTSGHLLLASVYDRAFFVEYGAANRIYATSCQLIARELYRRFRPTRVIDWGCGAALHAATFQDCGAHVTAVDAVLAPPDLRASSVPVVLHDLCQPISALLVRDRCDLALCLDVMEHIDERDSEMALINITRNTDLLLLSCAPPGQRGHHHLNEQPRRYWVERLARLGFSYRRRETGLLEQWFFSQRDQLPWSWMYHNLCVYRREPDR
jgi:hypothetical protein